jgi:hypothetical protein
MEWEVTTLIERSPERAFEEYASGAEVCPGAGSISRELLPGSNTSHGPLRKLPAYALDRSDAHTQTRCNLAQPGPVLLLEGGLHCTFG